MLKQKETATVPLHESSLPRIWEGADRDETALSFVHIPKTAGTWFTNFLARHFDRERIAPPLFGRTADTNFADPSKTLFCGHFLYSHISQCERQLLPLTILRDPIARTISQYRSFYNKANLSKAWRDSIPPAAVEAVEWVQTASFDDFIRSENPHILGHIRDVQTVYLASDSGPTLLDSAIANLEERFFFVGIQELSEMSLALFRLQTGSSVSWAPTEAEMNVSNAYEIELTPAGRSRLYELTENDRKLYAAAIRLFDKRAAKIMQTRSAA